MPKKSKKSKSKRQTLKQKYKVLKKVREHHRKKRREARKNGTVNKAPKDPGIPNNWPFKEELIQQLKNQKERAIARQKALRQAQREVSGKANVDTDLAALGQEAMARQHEFAGVKDGGKLESETFVDSSVKAFYKDFARVVQASDVVIEVLDARDPAGTRCQDVEKFIRRAGSNKKIVLLLNKIDLVPQEVIQEWLTYLREELPTVAFKCSTQLQASNLGRKGLQTSSGSSECLGADLLLQLLKNYARSKGGLKTSITVGIVGLPNVGKSSLINSLKRARVAQVGNTPGMTRNIQEVHLDRQVTLLDSPGIVFSESGADGMAAAALRNALKVESLDDPVLPVTEIVRRCPKKQLMVIYKVPSFTETEEFLAHVASARGKLRQGGTVDIAAAAKIVIHDWNDGRIPYYTRPPERNSEVLGTSAVVQDWGADFNADEVFAAEANAIVEKLPSMKDDATLFFQTNSAEPLKIEFQDHAVSHGHENGAVGLEKTVDVDVSSEISSEVDVDEMDEEDGPLKSTKTRSTKLAKENQNSKLYQEEGQLNPHLAKAQRKKRKKLEKRKELAEDADSDFDFDADWKDANLEEENAYERLASLSDD
jgi:nuclear GTP-binding protein